jgi:hypothetical protein
LSWTVVQASAQPADTGTGPVDFKVGLAARDAVEAHLQIDNPTFFKERYLPAKKEAYPLLIFVPGILGSKLERVNQRTQAREVLWGTTSATQLFFAQDLGYSDDQHVEATPLHTFTAAGVSRDIYGEGLQFIANQYFSDVTVLLPFAYDWRQNNAKSADELHAFLCKNAAEWRGRPVVFAAHSMGGLVLKSWFMRYYKNGALTCTNQAAGSAKITVSEVIFLGTPHIGSPKAIKVFADGYRLVATDGTLFGALFGYIDENTLASALNTYAATFPSVYQLLPSYGWMGCGRVSNRPPPAPILVKTGGTVHDNFDLFSAKAWRRAGWPKKLPPRMTETVFYEERLPRHLKLAKEFLCQITGFQIPSQIPVTYFYGQTEKATTDLSFVLENITGDATRRGSSVLRQKETGWGDGTVPSSIAMNAWSGDHRYRHFARSEHAKLLKSDEFATYVRGIIDGAQMRTEVALISEPEGRTQLRTTYAAVNALAGMPFDATRWSEASFAVVAEFNNVLLNSAGSDIKSLISIAEKREPREKAALLAVAATVNASSPLQKAQATDALAKAQLALGDWAGASDSALAVTFLAQALDSKQQRDEILQSAYHTGGWANLQLGETLKASAYLTNAQLYGKSKVLEPPVLFGYVPREDIFDPSSDISKWVAGDPNRLKPF